LTKVNAGASLYRYLLGNLGGLTEVCCVKCLDETPKEIADRMRAVAAGLSDPEDAEAIRQYAAWLEAHPDDDEVKDLVRTHDEASSQA
jgi:hypothetical protein